MKMLSMTFSAVVVAALLGCASREATKSSSPADTPPKTIKAVAELSPASDSKVKGTVTFTRRGEVTRVVAVLTGLTPGLHGFHIHEKGDCSAPDASSAGAHFNPETVAHGGPDAIHRHIGDFGNVEADAVGHVFFTKDFRNLEFDGPSSIVGRAVIIHANADDLVTQPSGNAGPRVACGAIQLKE
jgi:Cu-Zn family superoxide dismutase